MQKLIACLLFCGALLLAGCASSPPSIMPIEKNASPGGANYSDYGISVAQPEANQNAAPKNQNPLPKLPDIPKALQPKGAANGTLKLEGISPKANLANLSPVGAVAKAWAGEGEDGAKYYPLAPGGTALLSDGTKLELSSLNSDWSQGGVWATFVIGGVRRTVNVGQETEVGNWKVRAMDLYLPPEKVHAAFVLSDFGAQKELNLTIGTRIYTSSQKVYEVAGIYSGYAGNYSAVVLSEGQKKYTLEVGDEKPLPLE